MLKSCVSLCTDVLSPSTSMPAQIKLLVEPSLDINSCNF